MKHAITVTCERTKLFRKRKRRKKLLKPITIIAQNKLITTYANGTRTKVKTAMHLFNCFILSHSYSYGPWCFRLCFGFQNNNISALKLKGKKLYANISTWLFQWANMLTGSCENVSKYWSVVFLGRNSEDNAMHLD